MKEVCVGVTHDNPDMITIGSMSESYLILTPNEELKRILNPQPMYPTPFKTPDVQCQQGSPIHPGQTIC